MNTLHNEPPEHPAIEALLPWHAAGLIAGVFIKGRSDQGYETASYGQGAAQPGSFAIVRFAPQASAADVTRFLADNKVSVVDGPKPGGLYRIRIATTELPKDEMA